MADSRDFNPPPEVAMLEAMTAVGLHPADSDLPLVADGQLRRFRVEDDKAGTRNGYYRLHGDGVPAGRFGSWKTGHDQTWSAKGWRDLTAAEHAEQRERIERARLQAVAERNARHAQAADLAERRWQEAKPADRQHPYLLAKGIAPFCARQSGSRLVLPITRLSDDRLVSLQTIAADGEKRMLPGGSKKSHAVFVYQPDTPRRVVIAEGFATSATLVEMTRGEDTVLAAIDAGNLEPVAHEVRKRWPYLPLVIACDNDRKTEGNPGMRAGRKAAIATGGQIVWPRFPEDAPLDLSDFNDLAHFKQGGVQ